VIDNDNVKENVENVKENVNTVFENSLEMEKLKKELKEKFINYQKTMKYMLADAPIEVLCLPSVLEKILLDQGFLRVYDLFDVNFVEVKGIGVVRGKQLATRLDQFFAML
jgi:hypothetical protein